MNKIQTPHLISCKNQKKHWKIAFPDGTVSNTFFLYEDGIQILLLANASGKMSVEECCMIKEEMFYSKVVVLDDLRKGAINNIIVENEFSNFVEKKFKNYSNDSDFYMN